MQDASCHPGPLAPTRRCVRLDNAAAARVHANAASCASGAPSLSVHRAQDRCGDVPGAVYKQDTVRKRLVPIGVASASENATSALATTIRAPGHPGPGGQLAGAGLAETSRLGARSGCQTLA